MQTGSTDKSASAVWYSSDQSDFTPLMNSTWDFPLTFEGDYYDEYFIFGSSFLTDDYGDLYLECSYYSPSLGISGYSGKVYFTNTDGAYFSTASTLYQLIVYSDDVNMVWEFTVSGDDASGLFFEYYISDSEYSSAYSFSGTQRETGAYSYEYYLPYFVTVSPNWTGVALRNLSTSSDCDAQIVVYNSTGSILETGTLALNYNGQAAQVVGTSLKENGWIRIFATEELAGLSFVGKSGSASYMADISLIDSVSTNLVVPHVAQDSQWDTTIMICNPNNVSNLVNVTLYKADGSIQNNKYTSIAANGSTMLSLSTLANKSVSQGSVRINASYGVAAFALYNDIKNGGYSYAGISAVPSN